MEKIFSTVSTIFKERYGAQLKIDRRFNYNKVSKTYFRNHWNCPFVYSRTLRQVSFPIFNSKKELQAIATASPVENKDAVVFDEMAQFLQLTIAEHIELTDIKETQARTASVIERAHASSKKVVELRTRKKPENPAITFKKPKVKKKPDLQPIWISGDNLNFSAHIAFSIHDWVSNWAFINATEIPDLVWEDPNHWENFSQVTIFIPNINSLSEDKVQRLSDNIQKIKVMKNKPLVVVTSSSKTKPHLEKIKKSFKVYRANDRVTARVQAHFLLYHYKESSPWTHQCLESDRLYFLPFSPSPKNLH